MQTEDRGPAHPFIDTVVYLSGRVVHKRSTNYEKYIRAMSSEKSLAQWLHDKVSQQHREVIADLEAGKLPAGGKEKSPAAAQAGAGPNLELKLTNPKSWFAAGNIILEIELSDPSSKAAIPDADVEAYLEHDGQRTPCGRSGLPTRVAAHPFGFRCRPASLTVHSWWFAPPKACGTVSCDSA